MKSRVMGLLAVALAVTSLPAAAAVIVGATGATTNMGESFPLVHSIDQSGLSPGYTSGVTDFDAYVLVGRHQSAPGTDWVSDSLRGSAVFDLGALYPIDAMAVWNFGTAQGNPSFAIQDITLDYSLDGVLFSPLGAYTLANPNGAPDTLAQILAFGSVSAQYVRMNVLSTYGSPAALGEVAFRSTIPEPGSLALLGLGLLGLGAAGRRRNPG